MTYTRVYATFCKFSFQFIRVEEDGDGAVVDEVHFLSGIRMQTGEEVVHSKISEQDEEEGDNTEDMVDDW